jgi:hypothetical protein
MIKIAYTLIAILFFASCTPESNDGYFEPEKPKCDCKAYHTHLNGQKSVHPFWFGYDCKKQGEIVEWKTLIYRVNCTSTQ